MSRALQIQNDVDEMNRQTFPGRFASALGVRNSGCLNDMQQQAKEHYLQLERENSFYQAVVQIYGFKYSDRSVSVNTAFYIKSAHELAVAMQKRWNFRYEVVHRENYCDYELMNLPWQLAVSLDRNGSVAICYFGHNTEVYVPVDTKTAHLSLLLDALIELSVGVFCFSQDYLKANPKVGHYGIVGSELDSFRHTAEQLEGQFEQNRHNS